MILKELLTTNNFPTENISEKILNYNLGNQSFKLKEYHTLFNGIELSSDNELIIINLEDNEFAKMGVFKLSTKGDIIEIGYDENCEIIYTYN